MKRYYFTTESKDGEIYEHCGNIRGARTVAKRLANEYGETVYINDVDGENIVDCVDPDVIKETTAQDSNTAENISISVIGNKPKKSRVQKSAERILKNAYQEACNYVFDMEDCQIVIDGFRAVRFAEKMPFDAPCDKIKKQQENYRKSVESVFLSNRGEMKKRYKLVELPAPDLKQLEEYIKGKKAVKEKDILWSFGEDFQMVSAKFLVDIIGCFDGKFKIYTFDLRNSEPKRQKSQAIYFCSDDGKTEATLMPVVR